MDVVTYGLLNGKIKSGMPEAVKAATDEWLDENIAQETGYVLDSTLTMSNAAAPADKVGELKTALSKVEEKQKSIIEFNYEKLIPPDDFTGTYLPVNVFYNNNGVITDYDAENFYNDNTKIYCSPDGDPTKTGLDPTQPTTLEHIRSNSQGKSIVLAKGIHYVSGTISGTNGIIDLVGESAKNTFVVAGNNHVFTQNGTNWVSTVSQVIRTIYDTITGFELEEVSSLAEITEYSYYKDSENLLTINVPFNPNNRIVVIEDSSNRIVLSYATSTNTKYFVKDITFLGGKEALYNYGDASHTPELVVDSVRVLFSKAGIASEYGNVLAINTSCERIYGDGLYYTRSNFVEINCTCANNTNTTTNTTNGSTAHNYSKGYRLAGNYFNNEGANVADTNNCECIAIACNASWSCAKDRTASSTGHSTGFIVENNCKMWLIYCKALENAKDIEVSGSSSTIIAKRCTYSTTAGNVTIEY